MYYIKIYSTRRFYVVLFLLICTKNIEETTSTSVNVVRGILPDPLSISRLFNTFVGPIMKSLPANKPVFRAQIDKTIKEAINEKVAKLRNFLQDNDIQSLDDNITFKGKDDTAIIEFIPKTDTVNKKTKKEKIKMNLKKYKKIREKISKALIKESVSDKTKTLVIKTIDDLLKKLLRSQCNWKRTPPADESVMIADRWNEGLHKVRTIINDLYKDKTDNRKSNGPEVLDNLEILFRSLSKDVDMISKKYKIQCEFIPKRQSRPFDNTNMLRNNWDKTDIEDEKCHDIHICSDELKEYLGLFYASLKDTSVNVLKNYAEMYMRDVASDNEKEIVISILSKVNNNTEKNVLQIFIKAMEHLKLDKDKNKDANIDVLSNYVKNVIRHVKKNITHQLNSELETIGNKTQKIIKDDIKVNIDVDLGNLEREFVSKICSIFRLCNGKYGGRRFISDGGDKNNLYVQVDLTIDDEMADINNLMNLLNAINTAIPINGLNITRTTHTYVSNLTT